MTAPTKQCTKCGEVWPFTAELFYPSSSFKSKANPLGLSMPCKRCQRTVAAIRARTPEVKAARKKYCQRPEVKEKNRRRAAANYEKSPGIGSSAYYSRAQKTYGVSRAFLERYRAEHPVCEGCGAPWGPERKHSPHIDHDHSTKKFRGLLCHGCNAAAGQAGDDPRRLRSIATYLEEKRVTA